MVYIEGKSRTEYRLKCLEQEISQNNQVRVIDAFIDSYKGISKKPLLTNYIKKIITKI